MRLGAERFRPWNMRRRVALLDGGPIETGHHQQRSSNRATARERKTTLNHDKTDRAELPPGPRQPRALPEHKGGVKVRHPQHGLRATINPDDLSLAFARGWERAE